MALPEDIDSTYADDGVTARQLHQQHHDTLHEFHNSIQSDDGSGSAAFDTITTKGPVFNVMHPDYGATGDGSTDDASAIQAAVDAAEAAGGGTVFFPVGTYRVTSTVTFSDCSVHADDHAKIVADGANPAVQVGTSSQSCDRKTLRLPQVEANTKVWSAGSLSTDVGISFVQADSCMVWFPNVEDFTYGVTTPAAGGGVSYNEFHFGRLYNNAINVRINPTGTGWANENLFVGGRYSHDSSNGDAASGTRHVAIDANSFSNPNGNVFLKPSLEGDVPEYHILIHDGSHNIFQWPRMETGAGVNPKIWFRATDATYYATRNEVWLGSETQDAEITEDANARNNSVRSSARWRSEFDGSQGGLVFSGTSDSDNLLALMKAGEGLTGDPTTDYQFRLTAATLAAKAKADAHARFYLNFALGRLYLGTGTADPTGMGYVRSIGTNFWEFAVNFRFSSDNTFDIGTTGSARPRDIHIARNAIVGGTIDVDTLRTKGPVYDVTHPDFGATGDGSTDDTSAIQAAIDAVEAAGGGVVYFPAATYLVSALTVQANGVTFRGDGRTASHLKTASGDLVTFTTGSRFRCEHMKVSSTSGGGHVFVVSDSLSRSEWYDLHVAQSNAAKSILQADDAGAGTLNYIDNVWEHVETYHVAAASVPTFNLRGGGVNRNRWIDWRPTYSGAYTILIETTAASSYANDNTIEGVTGEILDGGFFKGLGVRGTRLADIGSYDHSGATTNHLIEFGQATTGSLHSDQNEVDNARRHGGTLGSGKFDLSATGGDVTLINCGGSTAFSADFNSTESTVIGGNVTGTDDSDVRYLGMDGRDSFLKSDSIVKAAPELGATFGSPNMTTLGSTSFNYVSWMLGDSSSEAVGGHLDLRGTDWSTFDIVLYWSNNTANSGDVFLQVRYEFFGDGDTASNGTNANSTVTAPSQEVIEKTTLASGVSVTADKLLAFRLERAGSQAADTLTGDIAVLAIEFVRAS